jgi:hypothetical protein
MSRARRALAPIAALWLLCQCATWVLAPTLLWIGMADAGVACVCIHTAEAACPMHHEAAAAGSKVCSMRGLSQTGAATLQSLLGLAGLVPVSALSTAPTTVAGSNLDRHSTLTARPSPPDPPPPRA